MRPRIKVCGITKGKDARLASQLGADAVGFVLYPTSPRAVDPMELKPLLAELWPWTTPVAVTVHPEDELLKHILSLGFQWLQLSGHETPDRIRTIREKYGFRIIKAFHLRTPDDLNKTREYDPALIDLYLFDTRVTGQYGGTGVSFDWTILQEWQSGPFLLAGGLDVHTIRTALNTFQHPWLFGFDLSSRLESAPGIKDPQKLRELFNLFAPGENP